MAKRAERQLVLGFVLGAVVAAAVIGIWMLAQPAAGPRMARMMPMMQRATVIDCQLSEAEFAQLGDRWMGEMIGDTELHEQLDQQMVEEEQMHAFMARMMSGCWR